jgi:hypothetical protein
MQQPVWKNTEFHKCIHRLQHRSRGTRRLYNYSIQHLRPIFVSHCLYLFYNEVVVNSYCRPHCDGQCDGLPYNMGGRVATTVLYCKEADEGGALSFSRADVFIKPKRGTAAFFSYLGRDGKTDEGYTEHSSCPVTKGEKWAIAVWMRKGVSNNHSWEILDPQGRLILEPTNT